MLKLKVRQKDYQPIYRNSAAGYWSTFRAFLKIAYKEGYLKENIERSPEGGHCMRTRTQKTKTQATLALSEEALSLCGEPERGLVFKGLSRAHTRQPFKKWLKITPTR